MLLNTLWQKTFETTGPCKLPARVLSCTGMLITIHNTVQACASPVNEYPGGDAKHWCRKIWQSASERCKKGKIKNRHEKANYASLKGISRCKTLVLPMALRWLF